MDRSKSLALRATRRSAARLSPAQPGIEGLSPRRVMRQDAAPSAYDGGQALPALLEQGEAIKRIETIMLQMQAQIEQLSRAQSERRVTRTQEAALRRAVRERAEEICRQEGLPDSCRRLCQEAIRSTVREVTGCRAIGDIPDGMYAQALSVIQSWYMTGAVRRWRRDLR